MPDKIIGVFALDELIVPARHDGQQGKGEHSGDCQKHQAFDSFTAGTSHHASIDATTEEELDSLYHVHFKGVFFLTQKLLPLINDGGRIVNVSSGLTRITIPGSAPYASMKGAVEVLTRYLAKELGPRGIAVNTVAPGAIETDFSGGMVRDNPELNRRVADMTALGRAGVPDDIGPLIASLVGESHRWVMCNCSAARVKLQHWAVIRNVCMSAAASGTNR